MKKLANIILFFVMVFWTVHSFAQNPNPPLCVPISTGGGVVGGAGTVIIDGGNTPGALAVITACNGSNSCSFSSLSGGGVLVNYFVNCPLAPAAPWGGATCALGGVHTTGYNQNTNYGLGSISCPSNSSIRITRTFKTNSGTYTWNGEFEFICTSD